MHLLIEGFAPITVSFQTDIALKRSVRHNFGGCCPKPGPGPESAKHSPGLSGPEKMKSQIKNTHVPTPPIYTDHRMVEVVFAMDAETQEQKKIHPKTNWSVLDGEQGELY